MISYVYYDDTDCGGIVYHSNYITFCERARSLIFFNHNIYPHISTSDSTQGFVVKNIESSFIAPLKFADKYEVKTALLELKNTFVVVEQNIFKIDSMNKADLESINVLCFSAKIKLAFIDFNTKKPCKIPEILRNILVKYQQK